VSVIAVMRVALACALIATAVLLAWWSASEDL
jgi:hypothetical protein